MTHDLSAPPERRDQAEPETNAASPQRGDGGASDPGRSAAASLRRLALRVHFYAGVLVGPFLLVAALSGFFYALAPQAEKIVYHSWTTSQSEEIKVPLATQIATAERELPDLSLSSVVVGSPGQNTRVLFDDPQLPSSSYTRVVFVDPSTGDVPAVSVQYGSGQALPLRTWLSEVHRRLHLGEPGRIYSELAASWLAPIAMFGLYIWWDRRRRSGAPLLWLRRSERAGARWWRGPSRAGHRNRHAVLGAWIAIALLGLSATGLTWSRFAGENVSELRAAAGWETPSLGDGGEHVGHSTAAGAEASGSDEPDSHGMQDAQGMQDMKGMDGMGMPGMDMPGMGHEQAMEHHHAMPASAAPATVLRSSLDAGLSLPLQLTPPATEGGAWNIAETRRSYTAGPDSVQVDPMTGAIVERLDFADYPAAAKLADWGIRAHMGMLFGVVNQLLLAAVAASLCAVIVRGYIMWWKRRPGAGRAGGAKGAGETKSASGPLRLGKAPAPGAFVELARAHPLRTGLAALVVAAVGYFVPLLGLSLVAFLALDIVVQGVRRLRSAGRPAIAC